VTIYVVPWVKNKGSMHMQPIPAKVLGYRKGLRSPSQLLKPGFCLIQAGKKCRLDIVGLQRRRVPDASVSQVFLLTLAWHGLDREVVEAALG